MAKIIGYRIMQREYLILTTKDLDQIRIILVLFSLIKGVPPNKLYESDDENITIHVLREGAKWEIISNWDYIWNPLGAKE